MAVKTVRIKATREEGSRSKGQRVQDRILGKDSRQKQGVMGRNGGASKKRSRRLSCCGRAPGRTFYKLKQINKSCSLSATDSVRVL